MPRTRYVLLIAVAAYLSTGLVQVRPEERAVVRRFGRVVARPRPGLWAGLPWGVDRVDRVPVRTVRQLRAGFVPDSVTDHDGPPPGQFLTGDQNLVNVQLVLDYAIGETDRDLDDFVVHRDRVDAALAREVEASVAEWAAGQGVDDALLGGNAALPAWVMGRLPARVTGLGLGVRVQRVSVLAVSPPDEVRASFERVTQAQTGMRTQEYQARQGGDVRLRQADAVRYRLEQEADVFRRGQVGQARADAADFAAQSRTLRGGYGTHADALTVMWWAEVGRTLAGVKTRGGRVEPLDPHIGVDGLDVTQFLAPKRR